MWCYIFSITSFDEKESNENQNDVVFDCFFYTTRNRSQSDLMYRIIIIIAQDSRQDNVRKNIGIENFRELKISCPDLESCKKNFVSD